MDSCIHFAFFTFHLSIFNASTTIRSACEVETFSAVQCQGASCLLLFNLIVFVDTLSNVDHYVTARCGSCILMALGLLMKNAFSAEDLIYETPISYHRVGLHAECNWYK